MYRIKEHMIFRNYAYNDKEPLEICTEGYRLENAVEVMYIDGRWVDFKGNEYTAVTLKRIVGFNRKNTLTEVDKRLLRQSPEGEAYIEYNKRIGGDNIGLSVPFGYPPRVQAYLDEGHTIEEIYKECIQREISWEERFSCYIEDDPPACDSSIVEIKKSDFMLELERRAQEANFPIDILDYLTEETDYVELTLSTGEKVYGFPDCIVWNGEEELDKEIRFIPYHSVNNRAVYYGLDDIVSYTTCTELSGVKSLRNDEK